MKNVTGLGIYFQIQSDLFLCVQSSVVVPVLVPACAQMLWPSLPFPRIWTSVTTLCLLNSAQVPHTNDLHLRLKNINLCSQSSKISTMYLCTLCRKYKILKMISNNILLDMINALSLNHLKNDIFVSKDLSVYGRLYEERTHLEVHVPCPHGCEQFELCARPGAGADALCSIWSTVCMWLCLILCTTEIIWQE